MPTQFVASGVVSSGVLVTNGNTLEVQSSGTADVTSVTSGGIQQVDFGGIPSGTIVAARGSDVVFGSDTAMSIAGSLTVSSGGAASFFNVSNGGVATVAASGT